VQGRWPNGSAVRSDDRFYAASLTKQLTGAAMALLVKAGHIDPDAPIPAHFLPRWTDQPTVRQLLHHVGGLPPETFPKDGRWTNRSVIEAISHLPGPASSPGTTYAYSNFGYIILARLVEDAGSVAFGQFVAERLLNPLGIAAAHVHDDIDLPVSPQLPLLGPVVPLWTGDGGLWTTAAAFSAWLDTQNHDRLGIAGLVRQDASLANGQPVRYGWGIGLRAFRGRDLYIHGGSWRGARAKAVRCPALGLSVVALTADDREAPVGRLVDTLLERLAG
jgi:CubicO group peptidase (beta-lactamase class C family)